MFINKLQIESSNFLINVNDNREITLKVNDINLIVPRIIDKLLFELLIKNEGKYVTISENNEASIFNSFDEYISNKMKSP